MSIAFGKHTTGYAPLACDADGKLSLQADISVALSNANDSVAVYGHDGSANRVLATDASGHLQVDVLTAPASLATESTVSSIDGKLASLGQKAKTGSVPVTLASDEDAINVVAAASAESHANAWSAAAVSGGAFSTAVQPAGPNVSVFGTSDAATTISVQYSQDGTNYYTNALAQSVVGGTGGSFTIDVSTAAKYVRLVTSDAATITATIASR